MPSAIDRDHGSSLDQSTKKTNMSIFCRYSPTVMENSCLVVAFGILSRPLDLDDGTPRKSHTTLSWNFSFILIIRLMYSSLNLQPCAFECLPIRILSLGVFLSVIRLGLIGLSRCNRG